MTLALITHQDTVALVRDTGKPNLYSFTAVESVRMGKEQDMSPQEFWGQREGQQSQEGREGIFS